MSLLVQMPKGLFCPTGNFYIDPSGAVENAVITHAHSDHARRGSHQYYCAASGVSLLRCRLGKTISVRAIPFGETFMIGKVKISFHPAGHILGSAQVRLEYAGEVWVASGDYKRESDPTCEAFEAVTCDVFITEATFGTPSFRWDKNANLGKEIYEWWKDNASRGINSVLFAYSLGKTQRVLGVLQAFMTEAIYCTPAATEMIDCYRAQGIPLAKTICLSSLTANTKLSGQLFIVPQSFLRSPQAEVLGEKFTTAFASGWMARDQKNYDKGFLMSDHADWDDLLKTILETKAKRVYVQHRGQGALVRHLKKIGIEAFSDSALRPKVAPEQMVLF